MHEKKLNCLHHRDWSCSGEVVSANGWVDDELQEVSLFVYLSIFSGTYAVYSWI